MLTIGDKIKYFRKYRNMTQAELAERSGIHPVSIRKYETNKMTPQPAQIERLAAALTINAVALNGFSDMTMWLDTAGEMMSLLMQWQKTGIMTVRGERGIDGQIIADTAEFFINPVFGQLFSIMEKKDESKRFALPDLKVIMTKRYLLDGFLVWEKLTFEYDLMHLMSIEDPSPENQEKLARMAEVIEICEMQLQCSMMPVDISDSYMGY